MSEALCLFVLKSIECACHHDFKRAGFAASLDYLSSRDVCSNGTQFVRKNSSASHNWWVWCLNKTAHWGGGCVWFWLGFFLMKVCSGKKTLKQNEKR